MGARCIRLTKAPLSAHFPLVSDGLLSLSPNRLAAFLGSQTRARAVFRCLTEGKDPFTNGNLPPSLVRRLSALSPTSVERRALARSQDRTLKLLLEVPGEKRKAHIETVLIPDGKGSRTTLCVSSQEGCIRGCTFCLTATMQRAQGLSAEGIVAQVFEGLKAVQAEQMPPLRNIVFMGMGEPLDNWKNVNKAVEILVDPRGFGFGPRHVTVSTVGPTPSAIHKLHALPTRIAWSLHAARDRVRKDLVATQRHSVEALAEAFREVFQKRKDPLFVEITLIRGINDRVEDAEAVLVLMKGFPAEIRFNLLVVNPTGRGHTPSEEPSVEAFAKVLRTGGHFVMRRKARGADANAACGQLVSEIKLAQGAQ